MSFYAGLAQEPVWCINGARGWNINRHPSSSYVIDRSMKISNPKEYETLHVCLSPLNQI